MQCSDCAFFHNQKAGHTNILVCRRYPPNTYELEQNGHFKLISRFPSVQPDMWCGEYKPDSGE